MIVCRNRTLAAGSRGPLHTYCLPIPTTSGPSAPAVLQICCLRLHLGHRPLIQAALIACRRNLWRLVCEGSVGVLWESGTGLISEPALFLSSLCWFWRDPPSRSPCWRGQQSSTCGVHCGLSTQWYHTAPGHPHQNVLR